MLVQVNICVASHQTGGDIWYLWFCYGIQIKPTFHKLGNTDAFPSMDMDKITRDQEEKLSVGFWIVLILMHDVS